tara:strand:+ start:24123 stop:25109 length:987 start_codon:yes stop_codon:yes gene_type:complete
MVSVEALEAFKQSGLYDPAQDPDGTQALTLFMNAQNAGKIDAKGMKVQEAAPGGLTDYTNPDTPMPETGINLDVINQETAPVSAGSENQNLTSGQETLTTTEFSAPVTMQDETGKIVKDNEGQDVQIHDVAASNNAAQQGSNETITGDQFKSQNTNWNRTNEKSQSIDNQAQESVDAAKQEIEIGFKQPQKPTTLFGMAADKLDESGFTDASKQFAGNAWDYGMGQMGNVSLKDNAPLWNKGDKAAGVKGSINWGGVGDLAGDAWSGIKGAGGMLGAATGAAGGMLSGGLGMLGSAMHQLGSNMSGMQQPQYGPGRGTRLGYGSYYGR